MPGENTHLIDEVCFVGVSKLKLKSCSVTDPGLSVMIGVIIVD